MRTSRIVICILFLFVLPNTYLNAQTVNQNESRQPVSLENTEIHTLKSSFVDQEFILKIYLPASYESSQSTYPVLYLLDADKSFGMAADIAWWLSLWKEIPPIIIVGIAYGGSFRNWVDKRSRDYSPSKDRKKVWGEFKLAGGADNFTLFFENELFPFIDNKYRTDNDDKAIAGLSLGGLYVAYILTTKPEMFSRYIMSGAALIWDDKLVLKLEEEYSKKHNSLPAIVFSAVGELDEKENTIEPWKEFNTIIKSRNYQDFVFEHMIFPNETHISVWPASFTRGLKFIYAKR